jgi:hypothetical protein
MTGGDANGGLAGLAIMNGLFGSAIGMANCCPSAPMAQI